MSNINKKLEEIKEENFIIYIYFILLLIYLYANKVEVNYLKYKNEKDKEKYRLLLYIVFSITFIIALYYTIKNIQNLNTQMSSEIFKLEELSIIANILIVIATAIFLYIIYKDYNINLEVNL